MRTLLLLALTPTWAWAQGAAEMVAKGDALAARPDHPAALAAYEEADRLDPKNSQILQKIAGQYGQAMTAATSPHEKKELAQKSLAAAEAAVHAAPKDGSAHLVLAISCGRLAALESPRRQIEMSRRIREEAETAVRLNPRLEEGWHVLGRWHYELASLNPVLKSLAQAIYGRLPDASHEQAVLSFQKAVALAPKNPLHHIELGRAYLALGQKDDGRRALEKGLSLPATGPDAQEARQRGQVALRNL